MSDFKFSPSDFDPNFYPAPLSSDVAAHMANAKLAEWLSRGVKVYAYTRNDGQRGNVWYEVREGTETHSAILLDIQPIERECKHKRTKIWEPHLAGARKCLDCEKVFNPNKTPNWQIECVEHEVEEYNHRILTVIPPIPVCDYRCKKCGKRLKATWSVIE